MSDSMQTFCDTVWWFILKRCLLSKSLMWIPKVSSHWRKIFYQMHAFCLIKILLINNSRERIRFLACTCSRDSFARQHFFSVMSSLMKLSLLVQIIELNHLISMIASWSRFVRIALSVCILQMCQVNLSRCLGLQKPDAWLYQLMGLLPDR